MVPAGNNVFQATAAKGFWCLKSSCLTVSSLLITLILPLKSSVFKHVSLPYFFPTNPQCFQNLATLLAAGHRKDRKAETLQNMAKTCNDIIHNILEMLLFYLFGGCYNYWYTVYLMNFSWLLQTWYCMMLLVYERRSLWAEPREPNSHNILPDFRVQNKCPPFIVGCCVIWMAQLMGQHPLLNDVFFIFFPQDFPSVKESSHLAPSTGTVSLAEVSSRPRTVVESVPGDQFGRGQRGKKHGILVG